VAVPVAGLDQHVITEKDREIVTIVNAHLFAELIAQNCLLKVNRNSVSVSSASRMGATFKRSINAGARRAIWKQQQLQLDLNQNSTL
jgi:hypothetical protein